MFDFYVRKFLFTLFNMLSTAVNAACSRKALLAVVALRDPFHGVLYARGYPLECSSFGDGSREIKLTFLVDQCGTKVVEKPVSGNYSCCLFMKMLFQILSYLFYPCFLVS